MLTRRSLLRAGGVIAATGLSGGLAGCMTPTADSAASLSPIAPTMPLFYAAVDDEPYPLEAVPANVVPKRYWRQRVPDPTGEAPGTLVVDPSAYYLHFVEPSGTAMRYGIGVGKAGFEWAGEAKVQYKRRWPKWTPPAEMIAREPELAQYSAANGSYPPGPTNPLGARALYLFQNGEDTLYRIHGSPEAWTIGKAVSSGCIRLLNQDIIDLHDRVPNGARVVVRASQMPGALA
ncbi:L,D-transpeptidase [Microbaculum sp. FT89]|uniref:L,D-transpeptidase n=1 Tax=Microbaculum sp. FT89 TaxID=3447298 RepID=UPI003F52EEB3